MRNTLLATGLLISLLATAQTRKTLETRLEKVTIFLQGAQVERSASASLPAGKTELVFAALSPTLDPQSIQVKTGENITVLSVNHRLNYLQEESRQQDIKDLETKKEGLLEKIALQKNILNVFKQEETLLIKNQQIGGANNGLRAPDLKDAADFQRSRLTEVYQKQGETDRAIKKLEAELFRVQKQLLEQSQKAETAGSEISVVVQVKEAGNAAFNLTYLVKQAGWFPSYDIRVKDISQPIFLQYRANLFQSSGEDWKEMKLFLSTGNPNEKGSKPLIQPWYLKYVYQNPAPPPNTIQSTYNSGTLRGRVVDERGEPVPGASVFIKGTRTGTATDNNGFYALNMPAGNNSVVVSSVGMNTLEIVVSPGTRDLVLTENKQALAEVVVTAYGKSADGWQEGGDYAPRQRKEVTGAMSKLKAEDIRRNDNLSTTISYQPTTTVYEIKEPYTLPNDGKTYMAEIDGYEIKADYEYYAIPKLETDAYLTARIADWQTLNLLPGEASLFFEGTYLGKSLLDLSNAGDTLSLSLGRDKGVQVQRKLLKEYSSRRFLGANRTDTRRYEIVVRNNKNLPIRIVVEDQYPISTQKEIEIQDRKHEGAQLNEDSQVLNWTQTLQARTEVKLGFGYEVKYPKDKRLVLD